MSTINDGGPAFPVPEWSDAHGNIAPQEYGMTLRAYFAAHAPVTLQDARYVCGYGGYAEGWSDGERATTAAVLALMRVEYADALLAELAKVKP